MWNRRYTTSANFAPILIKFCKVIRYWKSIIQYISVWSINLLMKSWEPLFLHVWEHFLFFVSTVASVTTYGYCICYSMSIWTQGNLEKCLIWIIRCSVRFVKLLQVEDQPPLPPPPPQFDNKWFKGKFYAWQSEMVVLISRALMMTLYVTIFHSSCIVQLIKTN